MYIQWFSLGVLLVLLELIVPGTYLVWFGLSALVLGTVVYFTPLSLVMQLVLFAVLSLIFALLGWKIYSWYIAKSKTPQAYQHLNDLAAQHIGKIVTVTEDSQDNRSKVQVGDSVWIAVSAAPLKKGDRVLIEGVREGVLLEVKKQLDKTIKEE